MGSNQSAHVEGANEVDSDNLLENVQRLRLTVPEHDLRENRRGPEKIGDRKVRFQPFLSVFPQSRTSVLSFLTF